MSTRKLAHPNLCTLGGAGSEHHGPLQGMLARRAARFWRKAAEEGQLRIKQWLLMYWTYSPVSRKRETSPGI